MLIACIGTIDIVPEKSTGIMELSQDSAKFEKVTEQTRLSGER